MNKTERNNLQQNIQRMEEELAQMKESLAKQEEKKEQWHPKGGDYWVNNYSTGIDFDEESSTSTSRKPGVEFNSEDAANKAQKAFLTYQRLYSLAEELNEGWEPDWDDGGDQKWFIYTRNGVYKMNCWLTKSQPSGIFFKSSVAQEALRLITECNALLDEPDREGA